MSEIILTGCKNQLKKETFGTGSTEKKLQMVLRSVSNLWAGGDLKSEPHPRNCCNKTEKLLLKTNFHHHHWTIVVIHNHKWRSAAFYNMISVLIYFLF